MSKTRGLRSLAARQVVREKKIETVQWHCCNTDYTTMESISRHVYACHELDIAAWETRLKEQRQGSTSCSSSESDMAAFQRRRAPKVCCYLIVQVNHVHNVFNVMPERFSFSFFKHVLTKVLFIV